jgi:hypothetical protein
MVWYLGSTALLSLFAQPFLAWARGAGSEHHWSGGLFFGIDIAMGIWAVWLYSAIAVGTRSRIMSAAIVGVAWWTLKSLQSAKWAGLGLIPREVILAPLLATLPATVLATGMGAWLYEGGRKPRLK